MKITFMAPVAMVKAFEDLAAELGVTRSDLYRGALTEHLKRAKVDWEG